MIDVTEPSFSVIDAVQGISLGELQARADTALRPEIGVAGRGGSAIVDQARRNGDSRMTPGESIAEPAEAAPCKVLLVCPRFHGQSFWNLTAACEVFGAGIPAPPLGLITVAAMLPPNWECRLVNRNTEELTDDAPVVQVVARILTQAKRDRARH